MIDYTTDGMADGLLYLVFTTFQETLTHVKHLNILAAGVVDISTTQEAQNIKCF